MGSKDHFYRRKAKQSNELARKKAKRDSYDKVLIVCEGKKTEPHYFNDLKETLVLSSTNIIITGECDSSPISVVQYARNEYHRIKKSGDPFDKVFCVFDKDSHTTYQQALNKIKSLKPKNTFFSISSVPCFEYWLLLHFKYTTQTFTKVGNNSCCDCVIKELKKHLPDYQKGDNSFIKNFRDNSSQAKKNALKSLKESNTSGNDNPSTKVHELIEYLENIRIKSNNIEKKF